MEDVAPAEGRRHVRARRRVESQRDTPAPDSGRDAEHHLGRRVRELRQARGWSQAELADRLNDHGYAWHQTTVAKTELADRPIRVNEAAALAAILDVPLGFLVAPASAGLSGAPRTAQDRLHRLMVKAAELETEEEALAAKIRELQQDYDEVRQRRDQLSEEITKAKSDFGAALHFGPGPR